MATVIDTLVTLIDFKTNTTSIKTAEAALTSLEVETKALNVALVNLRHIFSGLFSIFAIEKLIELNNQYDISINKLQSLGIQGDKVTEVFGNLLNISNKTGTSVEKNVELYQQMSIALGDVASEADKLTVVDTLNKIFAINGTQTRVAQFALQDLSKAVAGATVNYQELRFALKDVPALQAVIAKHFEDLGQNWVEQVKGNRLATTEFIKILKDANIDLTKQFALTARTIPQAFQAIRNSLSFFIGELGKSSESVSVFTTFLDKISATFISLGDAIKNNTTEIQSAFGALLTFLSLVSIRVGIITARMLLPFIPLIAGVTFLTLAIQDLYVFLQGGSSVIGDFLHSIGLTDDQIKSITSSINSFISMISSLSKSLFSNKLVIEAVIAALITLGAAWASARVVSLFTVAINGLTTAFEFLNIAMKANVFGVVISSLILLITLAFEYKESIIKAFSESAAFITNLWSGIVSGLSETWKGFIDTVMSGFNTVRNIASKITFGLISGSDEEDNKPEKFKQFKGNVIDLSERRDMNKDLSNFMSNVNNPESQLLNGTTGNVIPQSAFSNINQNNENNINVTVNAETNASPEVIAQVATDQIRDAMGKQFKSAALNADSVIKR